MVTITKGKRKYRLKIGTILLLGLILWVGYAFGGGFLRNYRLSQEVKRLTNEIKAVQMRNDSLQAEIVRLCQPDYIERIAREELGLVKPGETLYILSQPLPEDAGIQVEKRNTTTTILD